MLHSVSVLCVGSRTVSLPNHTWELESGEHSYVHTAHSLAHLAPCLGKTAVTELMNLYTEMSLGQWLVVWISCNRARDVTDPPAMRFLLSLQCTVQEDMHGGT